MSSVPDDYEIAKLSPIPKKHLRKSPKSYELVSCTSMLVRFL